MNLQHTAKELYKLMSEYQLPPSCTSSDKIQSCIKIFHMRKL